MTTSNDTTSGDEWEEYWDGVAVSDLPTRLEALRRAEAELSAQVESGGASGEATQN